jgi:aromatic ring-opening dioxygenase LigB subunit
VNQILENATFEKITVLIKSNKTRRIAERNETELESILRVYINRTEKIHLTKITKSRNIFKSKKYTNLTWKKGVPDYFYKKNKEVIFVECKCAKHDGLRYCQFKWIEEHKNYKVRIIFVELI